MTDYERGYIDGLQASALVCEWETKGRKSRLAEKILQVAQKMLLRLENEKSR